MELEEKLFPVFDVPAPISDADDYDRRYKKSVRWDIKTGDFVLDGTNRMVECDGQEAYKVWCYKIAQTERYTCLAYPTEIGTEIESALKESDHKIVESMLERTITEALLVNPRTEYVRGFAFEWESDSVWVSFLVKATNAEPFVVKI